VLLFYDIRGGYIVYLLFFHVYVTLLASRLFVLMLLSIKGYTWENPFHNAFFRLILPSTCKTAKVAEQNDI
jgi:hypothetical protein